MSENKIAVVTGASAGIGKVFAQKLAAQKYDLFIVARREQELKVLAENISTEYDVQVIPVALDLAKKENRDQLLEKTGNHIDLLVNNAGFGYFGNFVDDSRDNIFKMIDLNVTAVTDLTYLYLQGMIERKKGEMIIVSSTTSFQPIARFSLYTATKTFERVLAQSLYGELRKHGVHVLALCPGKTRTEFSQAAHLNEEKFSRHSMSAEDVVDGCLKAVKQKKWEYIPGGANKLKVYIQRFFSRKFVSRMAGKIVLKNM